MFPFSLSSTLPLTLAAKRLMLLLVLGLLSATAARAQTTITLQEAIGYAQENSPDAASAQLAFEEAQWEDEAFEAQYLPSLSLTGSAPGLERSINEITQDNGSIRYVPQNRLSSTTRLRVGQQLPWTGTEIYVSSRLNRLDLFGDRDFSQWNAAPVAISIDQPIFQFNNMKWNRRLQPLQYRVSRRQYLEDRAFVAQDITDQFFNAYIARVERENAAFNVAINDTVYTLSQQRYEIGKIAENELLQSELELLRAQSDLSRARIEAERAVQQLKVELGMDEDTELELEPPATTPDVNVDPETAVAQARQRRPDFTNLELQTLQARRNLAQAKSRSGFNATISASYGLNQQATRLGAAYRDPLNQQAFGVNFDVPIFRWGEGEARVEAAQAQLKQERIDADLQRKELDQEVYFEARELERLQQQVDIAAKADTIAAQRFEVARNRYRIGTIDIQDLFDAQRDKDSAQQRYYQQLRQFWTSYYRLRRLTLYDFVRDRPLSR